MKYIAYIATFLALFSCSSDDDICISGEATPRMKLKFKESEGRLLRLARIIVDVDYGNGTKTVVDATSVDSIMIPLRVDNQLFTEVFVRTSETGTASKIKVNYTTEAQYVSPACGFKKLYKNVSSTLETTNPVKSIETLQTEIIDEKGTHLFLVF